MCWTLSSIIEKQRIINMKAVDNTCDDACFVCREDEIKHFYAAIRIF